MRVRRRLLVAFSLILLAAWALPGPAAQTSAGPRFTPVASILELMLEIVDPNADFIWESVSVVINRDGETVKEPRTDDEWLEVRHSALALAEAGNLLKIPGRGVVPAKPVRGIEPEPPGPDDLPLAKVEELIKANRTSFEGLAQGLTDAALIAVRAVDARSVDGLYEAGDALDRACENCHMVYWYPGAPSPGQ
jgi:hypothetical protein